MTLIRISQLQCGLITLLKVFINSTEGLQKNYLKVSDDNLPVGCKIDMKNN
mgnify:CR=1 FL=1